MPQDVEPQPSPREVGGPPASRRQFLTWLGRAFLGLWSLGAIAAIAAYLRPRARDVGLAARDVRVGLLDELKIGEPLLVKHGETPFYVVRLDATRVVAHSAVCTHLRCIVGFDRGTRVLACPCHDGRFDLSGHVLSGPPRRALTSYRVSVRAGEVFVQL